MGDREASSKPPDPPSGSANVSSFLPSLSMFSLQKSCTAKVSQSLSVNNLIKAEMSRRKALSFIASCRRATL